MSAIKQNVQGFREHPLSGNKERGYIPGNKELQKSAAKRGKTRYCFLKTVFTPKKAGMVLPIFTDDSYEYLYRSAENYSKLLDIPQLPPKDYITKNLFNYMQGILYDRQDITLVEDNGCVSFYIYFDTDFFMNKRYYIPCKILHKTKGKFKKIITNLLICLKSHGAALPHDEWDYLRFYEECAWHCANAINPDNISEDDRELMQLYGGIKEGGEIDTLFKFLEKEKSSTEALKKSVSKYKPVGEAEKKIIFLIKRGIHLLEKDSLRHYVQDAYDQLRENREVDEDGNFDEDDYEIFTINQLFRIVYDTQDKLTESFEQGVEQSLYSSSFEVFMDYIPATEIVVTPDAKKPLLPRYPELFFWWLEDLISAFEDYCKKDLLISILKSSDEKS